MVAHTKFITEIACHPRNDDIFSTSSLDGTIKQWSMQDTSKFVSQIIVGQPVWSIAYSNTGDYLVAISEHGQISVINCMKVSELIT